VVGQCGVLRLVPLVSTTQPKSTKNYFFHTKIKKNRSVKGYFFGWKTLFNVNSENPTAGLCAPPSDGPDAVSRIQKKKTASGPSEVRGQGVTPVGANPGGGLL